MGASRLTDAEVDALERIEVFGAEGVLVAIEGSYEGMGGVSLPSAALLGAVAPLAGRTAFVKLVGSPELAAAERDAFIDFCRSLRFAPSDEHSGAEHGDHPDHAGEEVDR